MVALAVPRLLAVLVSPPASAVEVMTTVAAFELRVMPVPAARERKGKSKPFLVVNKPWTTAPLVPRFEAVLVSPLAAVLAITTVAAFELRVMPVPAASERKGRLTP